MAGTNLTAIIIVAGIGVFTSGLLGALAYLAKSKLESIEGEIQSLNRKVEEQGKEMNREHEIVVGWLSQLTEKLSDKGFSVKKPDEVDESINLEE